MNGKHIFVGDQVKDKFGDWHIVMKVYENSVWVYDTQTIIHASNIIAVIHPER
jgi:hypothetical protein